MSFKEKIKSMPLWIKQTFLVICFISIGVAIFLALKFAKKPVEKKPRSTVAALVKVEKISPADIQVFVNGFGTVQPRVEVEIVPQVAGNIVNKNDAFKAGGFINAGQTIVEIDPRDYELAVRQARAVVAQAQVQLETETAEAKVAREEWNELNPGVEPTSPLVLREPQIRQAKAELESAQAALATAQLNLERTKVQLPIDVCISQDNIDLGQFANAGQSIGSAFGIEVAEIEVPLEDKDLAWFDIPSNPISYNGDAGSMNSSQAQITANFADGVYQWDGQVVRTTGSVDQRSRMVSIVVEVDKPFHTNNRPALLPGTFVDVAIKGKTLKNSYKIPRDAVHNFDEVWVVREGELKIIKLNILRSDTDFIYVNNGLVGDEYIVITPLDVVMDGMKVRVQGWNEEKNKQEKTE